MGERACYAVSSVNRACINERGDEGKEDLLRLPQAEYVKLEQAVENVLFWDDKLTSAWEDFKTGGAQWTAWSF